MAATLLELARLGLSVLRNGNLLVDLKARSLAGSAEGRAGVGVRYTAPKSGRIEINADVIIAGFDMLTSVGVPKLPLEETSIVSLQSSVEIHVTRIKPRRDDIEDTEFANRSMAPSGSPIPGLPIDIVLYDPKPISSSLELDVVAEEQLFICVGVKSKVVAAGLLPWVGTAKVLYGHFGQNDTTVQKIRIAYK